MDSKRFGYIRVSTSDQNPDRQHDAMLTLGISERDIFAEKMSGKDFERPVYQSMKAMLRRGDVVYIKSLDRFGRNKEQIMQEWKEITQTIGADIVVLDMPILDTARFKQDGQALSGLENLISDIVLSLLSYFAEEERRRIKERQTEGIAAAKRKGKHLGRPRQVMPAGFSEVYAAWKAGTITAVRAMEMTGLKRSKFYDMVSELTQREVVGK